MKRQAIPFVLALLTFAAPARAAVTFDYLFDGGYPLAVSTDGTVVAGNLANGGYGPFRWTQATGPMSLGRVTHQGGGGIPGLSADGTRLASTIATAADSMFSTQGFWTLGSGWQELMPPRPPDGGVSDGTDGNVYGLSGDGTTVVGLYWRPGVGNRAHASKWTQAAGVVDLGGTTTGQASRANCVNHDASVIGGWVETPTGPWRPAAWVDGSCVLLSNYTSAAIAGSGEIRCVSPDGNILAGFMSDSATHQRGVTMWKRTAGVFGPPQYLGVVEGTTPEYGINSPYSVSADGKTVAGYCSFDGDPFYTTGFIWTPATGVIDVNAFLAANGVYVDPNFGITSLTTMTPDGTQIFGYGRMLTPPYTTRAFRITVPITASAAAPAPPPRLALSAPNPNPSTAGTRMEIGVATATSADLSIFDAAGRHVATLLHGTLQPGRSSVEWNGRGPGGQTVAAGLYFARLVTPEGAVSRKLARVN